MVPPDAFEFLRESADADEAARLLVALMPHLDWTAVAEFHAMLSHRLASHRPVGERERRLGLLCDFIDRGMLPSSVAYTEAREREAAEGRHWPSQSSLTEAFGGYDRALSAAVRYCERRAGGRGAGAPTYYDRRWTKTYTRREVIEAIRRCRQDLGLASWPGSTVFFTYVDAGRRAARLTGASDPRLPTREQVRRCFESYAQAVDATRRTSDAATRPTAHEVAPAPVRRRRRRRSRDASIAVS